MLNEFYPPTALNLAPPKWMAVMIIALHCLPLPLVAIVAFADGAIMLPLGVVLGAMLVASLVFHLRQQRTAATAMRLETTGDNAWLLYQANGSSAKVELVAQINLGWWVLLLMEKDGRRFRLVVKVNEQPREQLHRLKVLRVLSKDPS